METERLIIGTTQVTIGVGYNLLITSYQALFGILNQQIELSKSVIRFVAFATREAEK